MIDQIKSHIKGKLFAQFVQPFLDAIFDALLARFFPPVTANGIPPGTGTATGGNISPGRSNYSQLKAAVVKPEIPDPHDEPYRDVRETIIRRHRRPTDEKLKDRKAEPWVFPLPDPNTVYRTEPIAGGKPDAATAATPSPREDRAALLEKWTAEIEGRGPQAEQNTPTIQAESQPIRPEKSTLTPTSAAAQRATLLATWDAEIKATSAVGPRRSIDEILADIRQGRAVEPNRPGSQQQRGRDFGPGR